jgi:putative flippase GtrA
MSMCGISEFNVTYIYLQYFVVDLHVSVSRYHLQLQILIAHISKLPLFFLLLLSIAAVVVVFVITFMQSSYNYMPETNDVSKVCSVSDVM